MCTVVIGKIQIINRGVLMVLDTIPRVVRARSAGHQLGTVWMLRYVHLNARNVVRTRLLQVEHRQCMFQEGKARCVEPLDVGVSFEPRHLSLRIFIDF